MPAPGCGRPAARRAALAAILLAASVPAARAAIQTVVIGELYDGGTVNLSSGDTVEVRLAAPPSGCTWAPGVRRRRDREADGAARRVGRADLPVHGPARSGQTSLGLACRKASDPQAPAGGLFRVLVRGQGVDVSPRDPARGAGQRLRHLPRAGRRPAGPPALEPVDRLSAGRSRATPRRCCGHGRAEVRRAGQGRSRRGPGRRPSSSASSAAAEPSSTSSIAGRPRKDAPPARRWGVFVAAAGVGP